MPPSETVHVSVVVPCRNEIRQIRAFLNCVLQQELAGIEMEILIADGMSVDGTRWVLREFERKFAAIRILDNPEQIAAAGLNRAIREARGEIIVRMDVHTIYAQGYVSTCVEVLNETHADNVGGPALTRAVGTFRPRSRRRFTPGLPAVAPNFGTRNTKARYGPCHTVAGESQPWTA